MATLFLFVATVTALLIGSIAFAQQGKNYHELISKAQNFGLTKDREKASSVLLLGLKDKSLSAKAKADLHKALNQLAKVFFTEKAQKAHELGESLYYSGSKGSIEHYQNALAIERNNVAILAALSRALIANGDHKEARRYLDLAKQIDPFDESVIRLSSLQLIEAKQWATYQADLPQDPDVARVLEATAFVRQSLWEKSEESLSKILDWNLVDPEAFFLRFETSRAMGQPNLEWGRTYVSLCKKVDSKLKRRHKDNPLVCSNLPEVKKHLAKLEGAVEAAK